MANILPPPGAQLPPSQGPRGGNVPVTPPPSYASAPWASGGLRTLKTVLERHGSSKLQKTDDNVSRHGCQENGSIVNK